MNAIKEDYVSFEIAILLKEKGFDEQCRAFYKCWPVNPVLYKCDNTQVFDYCTNSSLSAYNYIGEEMNIAAPTLQMACKWLREVHNKHCDIGYDIDLEWYFQIIGLKEIVEYDYPEPKYYHAKNEVRFKTYEEAVEAAIKYVLENLI